jgi:hypothetical protein
MSAGRRSQLNKKQVVLLVALGVVVLLVLAVLGYLLAGTLGSATTAPAGESPSAKTQFSLPTAAASTATPGPPAPAQIVFVPQTPLKGFSSCTHFGFKGIILAGNGQRLQNVQVVVWSKEDGLLSLGDVDAEGSYSVRIAGRPTPRKLWVQVFRDDEPVSEPVAVDTHINCQTGFQIYQVDWRYATP